MSTKVLTLCLNAIKKTKKAEKYSDGSKTRRVLDQNFSFSWKELKLTQSFVSFRWRGDEDDAIMAARGINGADGIPDEVRLKQETGREASLISL